MPRRASTTPTYYLRLLKQDLALGFDVLGDIICDPLLDPEELALEQNVIVQEIGAAHDVPEDWVFELFQQTAFPARRSAAPCSAHRNRSAATRRAI